MTKETLKLEAGMLLVYTPAYRLSEKEEALNKTYKQIVIEAARAMKCTVNSVPIGVVILDPGDKLEVVPNQGHKESDGGFTDVREILGSAGRRHIKNFLQNVQASSALYSSTEAVLVDFMKYIEAIVKRDEEPEKGWSKISGCSEDLEYGKTAFQCGKCGLQIVSNGQIMKCRICSTYFEKEAEENDEPYEPGKPIMTFKEHIKKYHGGKFDLVQCKRCSNWVDTVIKEDGGICISCLIRKFELENKEA